MQKIILTILIIFNHVAHGELLLELPAVCDGVWDNKTPSQQNAANVMSKVYKGSGVVVGRCFGWTNFNEGNLWYETTKDFRVHGVNVSTKQYLGNWPLTPWANSVRMKGEGITWRVRPALIAVKGGEYTEINKPEVQVLGTSKQYNIDGYNPSIGCLNQAPLRYGDVDNNASNELVLFLNNDFVVFSPALQKIIFATNLSDSDELKPERVADWFLDEATVNPQFVADSGTNNLIKAALPATRSFAKIYLDDFNNDGKKDIIVWRKLYESNLKTNPILGFGKVADLLVHYSLVDGEYQIQSNKPPVDGEFENDSAQQETLKGWLTTKNQTWQSGFPTKSECAGQEGQLIPEMHDPLLNDPDVLK